MSSLQTQLYGALAAFALCHWSTSAKAVQTEPLDPSLPTTESSDADVESQDTTTDVAQPSVAPTERKSGHSSQEPTNSEPTTSADEATSPASPDPSDQVAETPALEQADSPITGPEEPGTAEAAVAVEASSAITLEKASPSSVETTTEGTSNATSRRATARPPPGPSNRRLTTYTESPQNFAMELRIGPYFPDIDTDTGRTAQSEFFGTKPRIRFGVELDWQALRLPYVGSLGAGVSVGYLAFSGENRLPSGQENLTGQSISQESTLTIVPMSLVAVLRLDEPARRWPFPLVPYGKVGLGYALWSVHDGIGIARSEDGETGRGRSSGFQAALGAMFLLDFVEPSAARFLDTESGINNSYVFFEWTHSSLGGNDGMNVGDDGTWVTGIALEM